MKFIYSLIVLLMLGVGQISYAQQLYPNGLSGVWWNAQRSGEGILMEQLEGNRVFVSWFTYNEDDSGNQMYLTCNGPLLVNAVQMICDMYYTSGGKFGDKFSPALIRQTKWGSVSIVQNSCDSITLRYVSDETGSVGEIELTRPLRSNVDNCQPFVPYLTDIKFNRLDGFLMGSSVGGSNQCYDTTGTLREAEFFHNKQNNTMKITQFFSGECQFAITDKTLDFNKINLSGTFICSKPISTGTYTGTVVGYTGSNNLFPGRPDYEISLNLKGSTCESQINFKGF